MANTKIFGRPLDYWPYQTYNWNRWDNNRGTLNLADKAATARGMASVQSHDILTLGSVMRGDDVLHETDYDCDFKHELLRAGKYDFGPSTEQAFESGDRFTIAIHGMVNAHIDALCHVGHHGLSFNGIPFEEVVTLETGVRKFDVIDLGSLVTRAWFIDVPEMRGLKSLEPGDPVTAEDLMHFDGRVQPGDAIVVRTGRFAARVVLPGEEDSRDDHGNWSGLHVDCIDILAQWDAATIATDGPGDNFPSTTPDCSVPIHILTEAYLGLPLIHHLNLEQLSKSMASREDKSFLFMAAPLQIKGGTGSPLSPLAVL